MDIFNSCEWFMACLKNVSNSSQKHIFRHLDSWTEHLVVSLYNDQQMLKEVVDFY
jgi:hypothetical protein